MISKELYKEISGKWNELRDADGDKLRIYQKYERIETRYPIFLQHVDLFKGKHVLEIGANAGMAAMEIAKVAKQYTGVELASGYHQQSLVTRTYIENPNVCFNNCSVKSYIKRLLKGTIKDKPNACYMSYVLYHFENKEVEMFKEHILPLLDIIIVQSRFAKRNIKGRTKHNDYGFWHPDNVDKYLKEAGFSTRLIWHENKKFHFIIGTKKGLQDADTGNSGVHTESKSTRPSGWGSCERQGRATEGQPCGDIGREADTEGQGGDVLAEERNGGSKNILQPVVEESTTPEVCEADIPKVAKATQNRRVSRTRKNSICSDRPDVQG